MLMHHICTVYLYETYYVMNVWEVGSLIAFLHDFTDILVNIVKFMAETKYNNCIAAFFLLHMSIWFYLRCMVLPWIIYHIVISDLWPGYIIKQLFIYLLSCLCLLHYFWFILFILAIGRYMRKGETVDPRDEEKREKGKK
jgi:hypothetical protein